MRSNFDVGTLEQTAAQTRGVNQGRGEHIHEAGGAVDFLAKTAEGMASVPKMRGDRIQQGHEGLAHLDERHRRVGHVFLNVGRSLAKRLFRRQFGPQTDAAQTLNQHVVRAIGIAFVGNDFGKPRNGPNRGTTFVITFKPRTQLSQGKQPIVFKTMRRQRAVSGLKNMKRKECARKQQDLLQRKQGKPRKSFGDIGV